MTQDTSNWNKVDIIAVDKKGDQYELKDCTLENNPFTTISDDEEEERPRSFSCSFEFQGSPEVNRLFGFTPEGMTFDFRLDKPIRFERHNRFRCPRKRKKALKREIHNRLHGTETKEQLTQHYQEEWSLIRKEK